MCYCCFRTPKNPHSLSSDPCKHISLGAPHKHDSIMVKYKVLRTRSAGGCSGFLTSIGRYIIFVACFYVGSIAIMEPTEMALKQGYTSNWEWVKASNNSISKISNTVVGIVTVAFGLYFSVWFIRRDPCGIIACSFGCLGCFWRRCRGCPCCEDCCGQQYEEEIEVDEITGTASYTERLVPSTPRPPPGPYPSPPLPPSPSASYFKFPFGKHTVETHQSR